MEVWSPLTGRRGVCLPFSDFCGPLLFGGASTLDLNRLAEVAALRKWKYFELRDRSELSAPATPAVSFYGHRLDLKRSAEALLAGFRGSVRRALHKAESSGLTVEVTLERETILEFYWLHARTRIPSA